MSVLNKQPLQFNIIEVEKGYSKAKITYAPSQDSDASHVAVWKGATTPTCTLVPLNGASGIYTDTGGILEITAADTYAFAHADQFVSSDLTLVEAQFDSETVLTVNKNNTVSFITPASISSATFTAANIEIGSRDAAVDLVLANTAGHSYIKIYAGSELVYSGNAETNISVRVDEGTHTFKVVSFKEYTDGEVEQSTDQVYGTPVAVTTGQTTPAAVTDVTVAALRVIDVPVSYRLAVSWTAPTNTAIRAYLVEWVEVSDNTHPTTSTLWTGNVSTTTITSTKTELPNIPKDTNIAIRVKALSYGETDGAYTYLGRVAGATADANYTNLSPTDKTFYTTIEVSRDFIKAKNGSDETFSLDASDGSLAVGKSTGPQLIYNATSGVLSLDGQAVVNTITAANFEMGWLDNDTHPALYTVGKTYGGATSGMWAGFTDASTFKLDIGSSTNYLRWDGSALDINGRFSVTSVGGSSFTVDPANTNILQILDSNNAPTLIASDTGDLNISGSLSGHFTGTFGYGIVGMAALSQEVKDTFTPVFTTQTGGTNVAVGLPIDVNTDPKDVTINVTAGNGNPISITTAIQGTRTTTNAPESPGYTNPVYTITVYRGSVGGTVVGTQTVTGTSYNFENKTTNLWSGNATIDESVVFQDTGHGMNGTTITEVTYIIRVDWVSGGDGISPNMAGVVDVTVAETNQQAEVETGTVDLSDYVTLDTAQTITGVKTFNATGAGSDSNANRKGLMFGDGGHSIYQWSTTDDFWIGNVGAVGGTDLIGMSGSKATVYENGTTKTLANLTDSQTWIGSQRIDTTGRALIIGGDTTLNGADASIYLGNAPSEYGFDITYEGTGSGNTNALVITSTNAGNPKELLRSNQDGIVKFPSGINASGGISGLTLANGISGNNFNITGVNQIDIADHGEGINFTGRHLRILDEGNKDTAVWDGVASMKLGSNWVYNDGYHPYTDIAGRVDFASGTSLYNDSANYAEFKSAASTTGLKFRDSGNNFYGYVYGDSAGANFGLLNRDGQWAFRSTATASYMYHDGAVRFHTTSTGGEITGTLQIDDGNTAISKGSNNAPRLSTNHGYIEVGAQNTSHGHIYTDRPSFYFNKELLVLGNKVFYNGYHPNADKWTTARTITLSGDASGSVSIDGSGNVSLPVTVADDSHTHDGRYYTESEINSMMNRGYVSYHQATNLAVGWYTIAVNTGDRATARFGIWDVNSGDHQSVTFYAAHHFGTDASNTLTVLDHSYYSGSPFRHIRIKDAGTYDGAALQVYIDDATNNVNVAILGDNFQSSGWVLTDWIPDATTPPEVSNYANFGERSRVDLNTIAQGGLATTGEIYCGGDTNQNRAFHDAYHPNADKWTTARTITLNGDASGSVSIDGSANKTLSASVTSMSAAGDNLSYDHTNGYGVKAWRMTYAFGTQPAYPYNTVLHVGVSNNRWFEIAAAYGATDRIFWRNQADSQTTVRAWKQIYHDNYHPVADWADQVDVNTATGNANYNVLMHSGDTVYQPNGKLLINPSTGYLTVKGSMYSYTHYVNGNVIFTTGSNRQHIRFNGSDNATAQAYIYKDPDVAGIKITGTYLDVTEGLRQDGHTILNGSDTWLRTKGNTGWYSATHGGGMYMTDSTYVRTYNNKCLHSSNTGTRALYVDGGIRIGGGAYYGRAVTGIYSSTRFQGVFAMGDAYQLGADGISPGNLYGIAWTHSNNTNTNGRRISGHHACFMVNGTTKTAIGDHIWTSGGITGATVKATSARRYKDIHRRISLNDSLNTVVNIGKKGVAFGKWNAERQALGNDNNWHRWFIAEEVAETANDLVEYKEGKTESLDYVGMIPDAYAAIAAQQEMIEKQAKEIEELKLLVNQLLKGTR